MNLSLDKYIEKLDTISPERITGIVTNVTGLTIESKGPKAAIGEICLFVSENEEERGKGEVVGFRNNLIIIMPLGKMPLIKLGDKVYIEDEKFRIPVGNGILGRVLNGIGEPIDGLGPLNANEWKTVYNDPPNPMDRIKISEQIFTGIRTIDIFVACGKGQRTGIFAGSGVGKSVLQGMIARNTNADINVIALIGERGREVREFIENDLGKEGLKRSVVIVVTSDEPALLKVKGILVANRIAEYFRDKSLDVMLLVDSLSRLAMAQREIGLAVGEPPTTKGYTPSVFSLLPKIIERAGYNSVGSITGFYTVLVDGDDMDDPIADACRSFLDGHIVLSRKLAERSQYPAIDILQSTSRLMKDVSSDEHLNLANDSKSNMANYEEAEDLIHIGAYVIGNDPKIDRAIQVINPLIEFMRQNIEDRTIFDEDLNELAQILHLNHSEESQVNEEIQV